jgi:hypothetical protein
VGREVAPVRLRGRLHDFLTACAAVGVTLVVLALVGGLLVLLEPRSSSAPVSSLAAPSPAAVVSARGEFGSGPLGNWQNLARRISTEDEIRDVQMFNGIFMFGDSISVQDGAALEVLLTNRTGDSIAFHNWSGQPTSAAVDALADWERRYGLPSRILMAVGSNDIYDPPALAAQIERVMHIAGPSRTVFWVNVHVSRFRQPADVRASDQRNSDWVNQQLDDAALRHPNLRIVRWAEYLAAQPGGLTPYLRDGVHTTVPVGQNARNGLIVSAIEGAD